MKEAIAVGSRRNRRAHVLAFLAVSVYLCGVSNNSDSAYVTCCVFISALVVGLGLSRAGLSGLEGNITLKKNQCFEGQPLPLALSVKNKGSLPKMNTVVVLKVENRTQGQKFEQRFLLPILGGGDELFLELPLTGLKRGVNTITSVNLEATDPLGLFRNVRSQAFDLTVTVYPKLLISAEEAQRLRRAFAPLRANGQRTDPLEYRGVREYAEGDELRFIHWMSSARRGELVVKLSERERTPRLQLILDTHANRHFVWEGECSLEHALRFVASLAVAVGERLELIMPDEVLTSEQKNSRASILERLAQVKEVKTGSDKGVLERWQAKELSTVQASQRSRNLTVYVAASPLAGEIEALKQMAAHGVKVLVVWLGKESGFEGNGLSCLAVPSPKVLSQSLETVLKMLLKDRRRT